MTKAEWLRLKQKESEKPTVHKKISNNFIDNTLHNPSLGALKIVYYLSTKLKNFDYTKDLNTIIIDTKDMLNYTELTMPDIKRNLKRLQETSITFINQNEQWEEFIALLPRVKIHLGRKKRIEIDIYSKIAKLIVEVVDNYTFIDTKELMKLKFKHSIRMLPFLRTIQGYDVKQKTLYLNDLNEFFGTEYKKLIDIERKILKKVKEELDNNSKLTFDFEMNFEQIGKTKSKITSITIKPILKNNYQTTIFSNFDDNVQNDVQEESKPQVDKYKLFIVDKLYLDKIEYELGYRDVEIMDEQRIFLDFCKKNKKQYKDMSRSFYTHLKKKRELGL